MLIGGIQKFTLIDYPGKIAATIFTTGCNFRCPFCHNPEIVDPKKIDYENNIDDNEIITFLESRKGNIEGVCITGGEPTLQVGLSNFIKKIKRLGFLVKIDTNGSHPKTIKDLIEKNLIDYLAMDIKTSPEKYYILTKKTNVAEMLEESISLISDANINNIKIELRTTVVPGIVGYDDFDNIIKWINDINTEIFTKLYRYSIQNFKSRKNLDKNFENIKPYPKSELCRISEKMKRYCKNVVVMD